MTDDESGGPLDVATLGVLARRATTHPVVEGWTFQPDGLSSRYLEIRLDADQYPTGVETARLDVRWFEGGEYTVHYLESRREDRWQCRWDRHPKPGGPEAHFHPPPDASAGVEDTGLEGSHHLDVLFAVLDRVQARIESLHERETSG